MFIIIYKNDENLSIIIPKICAYVLTMMLDSNDNEINGRIEKFVETGMLCVEQPWSLMLAQRCLEVCLKENLTF